MLEPFDPGRPVWTVFELAGHFDISIGLTRMLIAGRDDSQPARDRTSFFINPRSESAPVVYEYAYTMVEGKVPADMPDVLHETFSKTIEEARATPADTVGPGYFASMRVDEFVASRIVEAVVHGLDLTLPLGLETIASKEGIAATAAILDDLLARRTLGRALVHGVGLAADALYGASTQRAVLNFPISGRRLPDRIIEAYALLDEAGDLAQTEAQLEEADQQLDAESSVVDGRDA